MEKLELLLIELDWLLDYVESQAEMSEADKQVITESLSFLYRTFDDSVYAVDYKEEEDFLDEEFDQ